MVLGDGILVDDRSGLGIVPEGGTGIWGIAFEKALIT